MHPIHLTLKPFSLLWGHRKPGLHTPHSVRVSECGRFKSHQISQTGTPKANDKSIPSHR